VRAFQGAAIVARSQAAFLWTQPYLPVVWRTCNGMLSDTTYNSGFTLTRDCASLYYMHASFQVCRSVRLGNLGSMQACAAIQFEGVYEKKVLAVW
jgi:hypothetical protein